jgi:hypothetical protein
MNKIISFSYNSEGEPTALLLGALRGELWAPATFFSCLTGERGETKSLNGHLKQGIEFFECDDNDQERILYWLRKKKPDIYMNLLSIIWDEPVTMSFRA